jgi:hypothetical protein
MIELVDVVALTLKNPWAHLVAWHGKTVENRTWMPWEGVDRLLIHAGKGWDDGATEWVHRRFGIDVDGVETGAIVAVADLAHGCNASRWSDTIRCGCGPWAAAGQCHWVFGEVRPLIEVVPCTGRQGLWRPTPDVLAAVQAQLAGVG